MAEGHVDAIETAVRVVDAVLRLISRNGGVRVVAEVLGKDDLIGPSTADRKCVTNNAPLLLSIQAEALAEVMNEADQHHPAWMAIAADGFGGLQDVLDLGEVGVRITVIHQSIQKFSCLPD